MQACLQALSSEFRTPANRAPITSAADPVCPAITFLTECCTLTGRMADRIRGPEMRAAFQIWQMRTGQQVWTERKISTVLRALSDRWKSPSNGRAMRAVKASSVVYAGLQFTPNFAADLFGTHKESTAQ
jgi:hypothetical protein